MRMLHSFISGRAAVYKGWLSGLGTGCLLFLGLLGMFLIVAPEGQTSAAVFGVIYPVLYDCLGRRSLAAISISLVTCQLFPEIAQSFDAIGKLI